MSIRTVTRLVHWLLLVFALLTVVSGLGITEFRIVETLTFGVFGKAVAFKLHLWVWIPFLVLLAAHVLLTTRPGWFRRRR
jgi:thiosulfate reductase cytochrome b subunit